MTESQFKEYGENKALIERLINSAECAKKYGNQEAYKYTKDTRVSILGTFYREVTELANKYVKDVEAQQELL